MITHRSVNHFAFAWGAALLVVATSCLSGVTGCKFGATETVEIGSNTYVCVVINGVKRAVYAPVADEYTRVMFEGSFSDNTTFVPYQNTTINAQNSTDKNKNWKKGKSATVFVESMGLRSMQKDYKVEASNVKYASPTFTVVIHVEMGTVKYLTWDDGCMFCQGIDEKTFEEQCQWNTYIPGLQPAVPIGKGLEKLGAGQNCFFSDTNDCIPSKGNKANTCDLSLYISWDGTDKNGNYFKSSGMRMSRFKSGSAIGASRDFYKSARDFGASTSQTYKNIVTEIGA